MDIGLVVGMGGRVVDMDMDTGMDIVRVMEGVTGLIMCRVGFRMLGQGIEC